MQNLIGSGTTNTYSSLRRNNFSIAVDSNILIPPSETSNLWFAIDPPTNGYTVYAQKVSQGPSIRVAQNDSDFILISQQYAQNKNILTVNEGLSYFDGQSQFMVTNIAYPSISTSGLTVFLDAGYTPSYCRTGANWNDLSGTNSSAILFNSPAFSLSSGGVFVFNGTNNFASGSFSSLSTFTFGAWVNVGSVVNNSGILSSTNSVGLQILNNGFQFFNAPASGTTISINTWYYVVGTQDATTQRLYINGSLVSSANTTTSVSGTYYVGKRYDDVYFNGTVGCIQIYNRALTPAEVSNNYSVQYGRYSTVTLTPTPTPSFTPTQTITPTPTLTPTLTPSSTPPGYTIIISQDGLDLAAQNGDILIT
jgi:hypothetical protein